MAEGQRFELWAGSEPAHKISSLGRYDRFGICPYIFIYSSIVKLRFSAKNSLRLFRAEFLLRDLKVGNWLSQFGQINLTFSRDELLASPLI